MNRNNSEHHRKRKLAILICIVLLIAIVLAVLYMIHSQNRILGLDILTKPNSAMGKVCSGISVPHFHAAGYDYRLS